MTLKQNNNISNTGEKMPIDCTLTFLLTKVAYRWLNVKSHTYEYSALDSANEYSNYNCYY